MASREEVDSHPGPEALAQEKELLALLAEMIQMLPGTYRQILDLRLYQASPPVRPQNVFIAPARPYPPA